MGVEEGANPAIDHRVGLCGSCAHVRVVRSGRGSTFYLCGRSSTDRRFSKYPRLPVAACVGYERDDRAANP